MRATSIPTHPPHANRDVLSQMGRRVAYVQCTETLKPRQLLGNVWTQLHGYKRKKAEGYAALSVESPADFFKLLAGATLCLCVCVC